MLMVTKKTNNESLPEMVLKEIIEDILAGEFPVGSRLPPERDLAFMFDVSRPVAHAAVVELDRLGLVTLRPRHGAVINDYREQGSLVLLEALFQSGEGTLDPAIVQSLLHVRRLMGVDMAGLAAINRRQEDIDELDDLVKRMKRLRKTSAQRKAELDFQFHHNIALASGNLLYPMLLNSFKPLALNLTGIFYKDPAAAKVVHALQRQVVDCLIQRDAPAARQAIEKLFMHGETVVTAMLTSEKEG